LSAVGTDVERRRAVELSLTFVPLSAGLSCRVLACRFDGLLVASFGGLGLLVVLEEGELARVKPHEKRRNLSSTRTSVNTRVEYDSA
jgi:hypothetical protein